MCRKTAKDMPKSSWRCWRCFAGNRLVWPISQTDIHKLSLPCVSLDAADWNWYVKVEIYQYTDSTTVKHEKIRDAPIHPGCLWSPMTFLGQIPNLSSFTVHFPFSGGEFSSKIPTLRVRITSKKKAGWLWRKKHLWHLIFGQTRKSPHRNGFMTSETLVLSGGSTLGKKKTADSLAERISTTYFIPSVASPKDFKVPPLH